MKAFDEGFDGFRAQLVAPERQAIVARAKAMGMTIFCMGEIVHSKNEVFFGWQVLPAKALMQRDDPKAAGIDWTAPRPALFSRLPVTVAPPPGRKRQRAEPEAGEEPRCKKPKGDS